MIGVQSLGPAVFFAGLVQLCKARERVRAAGEPLWEARGPAL